MKNMLIISFIIMTLFTGCKKKDTNPGRFEGVFSYEKRVLLDMIDIFDRYNNRIFFADTPEKVADANEEFCDKYEIFKPEITFVTDKHPDWKDNPPEEMKSIVQGYQEAYKTFLTISLSIVYSNKDKYPDNEKLIQSYERLSYLIAPRNKDKDKNRDPDPDTPDDKEE